MHNKEGAGFYIVKHFSPCSFAVVHNSFILRELVRLKDYARVSGGNLPVNSQTHWLAFWPIL